ncbi:hypothetical protein EGI31_21115 [Lacihabitans soyangensis]|uniref:Uncharacterized protein n=1 Tax=Lacihabitans soyangensis TaxID=869394 RepID=A0AAE3KUY7_9BACT|nr:hypothetical protein [Lacihabitans soyangensis]
MQILYNELKFPKKYAFLIHFLMKNKKHEKLMLLFDKPLNCMIETQFKRSNQNLFRLPDS